MGILIRKEGRYKIEFLEYSKTFCVYENRFSRGYVRVNEWDTLIEAERWIVDKKLQEAKRFPATKCLYRQEIGNSGICKGIPTQIIDIFWYNKRLHFRVEAISGEQEIDNSFIYDRDILEDNKFNKDSIAKMNKLKKEIMEKEKKSNELWKHLKCVDLKRVYENNFQPKEDLK